MQNHIIWMHATTYKLCTFINLLITCKATFTKTPFVAVAKR
jgi:hypothetical protein